MAGCPWGWNEVLAPAGPSGQRPLRPFRADGQPAGCVLQERPSAESVGDDHDAERVSIRTLRHLRTLVEWRSVGQVVRQAGLAGPGELIPGGPRQPHRAADRKSTRL